MDVVLLHGEAELFIKNLEKASLKDIGSPRWFLQHEHFEKLNMQAIVNASALQETFVKDLIISYEQISTLVHELILTEVWKCKILPIICKLKDLNLDSSFLFCMVIHHEATIINLLETIMFHKESCEAAGDSALDLLDYCLRKLTQLAGRAAHTGVPTQDPLTLQQQVDSWQDLERQRDELDFDIAIKCLSVLCFLIEHIDSLGLSVLSRMLNTHNLPCLLVQLVEHCPWSRGSLGKLEKYTEGKWRPVSAEDHLKLNKHDGLLWMCLFNLLLSPDCHRKYQFNSFNKEQLLKLRVYLSDTVMDQIPNLVELQRFLSQLAITDPVPPKKELILEMVPEIWSDILTENSGKWKAIAKHQVKHFFKVSDGELRERASRLAQTYNLDAMMNLLPDPAKCGSCGSASVKRCSRCQNEWYCNRECQVKHWPKHKTVCNQMSELLKKQEDPS